MIIVHAQLLEAPTVGYEEDNCSPWITSNDLTVLRTSRSYVDKALALPIPPAEGAARIWAEKIPYLLSDRFYHGDDLVSKLYQQFCPSLLNNKYFEIEITKLPANQGNPSPQIQGVSRKISIARKSNVCCDGGNHATTQVQNYWQNSIETTLATFEPKDFESIAMRNFIKMEYRLYCGNSPSELRSRAKVDVIDQAPLTQTTMERKMTKPKTDAVGSFCSEFDVEIRGQKRSRKSGHFRKLPYGELHCQGECYTNRKTSFFKDVKLRTSGMTTSCSKSVRIHMIRRVYATARKARDILEACHIRPTRGHHGTNLNPPK
ncbi:hypothetical protein Tco_0313012 [Tanacetum coccineum]